MLDGARATLARFIAPGVGIDETRTRATLATLVAYYESEGLYERLRHGLAAAGELRLRPQDVENIRGVARPVVEFHAAHLFPGALPEALPLKTENGRLAPAIERVWQWSNFSQRKQAFARWVAIREGFIKVAQKDDGRPYFQVLDPRHVLEHETNERGHTVRILVQYPTTVVEDAKKVRRVHTEEWTKERYRRWLGERDGADLEKLDGLRETKPLEEFGIDFVPFVWAPFSELVPGVGIGAFEPHLAAIDNKNAAATRLDSMLFRYNRAVWGLEGTGTDADGRPLPPPSIEGSYAQSYDPRTDEWSGLPRSAGEGAVVKIGGDPFYRLPSGWSLKSLVADVDFRAALDILLSKDDWEHVLMPEVLYFRSKEGANESGIARRYKLSAAIDRNLEARGNAEAAIARADAMGLTMGQNAGLPEFRNIGSYEAGDFEHAVEEREVLPTSEAETAEVERARTGVLIERARLFRELGMDTAELRKKAAEDAGLNPEKVGEAPGEDGVTEDALGRSRRILAEIAGNGTDPDRS
jgi:hypothetical protein